MELVELKSIWEKTQTSSVTHFMVTEEEVETLINKRSKTAISKISRIMKYKIWMMGIVGVLGMVMSPMIVFLDKGDLIMSNLLSREEIGALYFFMSLIIFYFSRRIKNTRQNIMKYQQSSSTLKVAIENILGLMKKITDLAVNIAGIMNTFIFGWIFYVYLYRGKTFMFDERLLYLLLFAVVSYKLLRYLERRTQNKKYGKYIKMLEGCLNDLNAEGKEQNNM